MPATRGQVWLAMAGGFLLSVKALQMLGRITRMLYEFIGKLYGLVQKSEAALDWLSRLIDKFPDPEVVVDKLMRVNGHEEKEKGKAAKE